MICLKVMLIGFVMPFTPVDKSTIKRATFVCKTQYKSCIKAVIKKDATTYHIICKESK